MTLTAWNLEWTAPRSSRRNAVLAQLGSADVHVLSEVNLGALPEGHVADAGPDWGYEAPEWRRKVALVGAMPWTDVTRYPDRPLRGRCVAATRDDPGLGEVRVIGVCIPWLACHQTSGRRDRARWEEHLDYLAALSDVLDAEAATHERIIVAGDFNQRIPATRAPKRARAALEAAFAGWDIPTAAREVPGHAAGLLNHVALRGLRAREVSLWPGTKAEERLSDHAGARLVLGAASA